MDSLSLLSKRNKLKITENKEIMTKNGNGYGSESAERLRIEANNNLLKAQKEIERRRKIEEYNDASRILCTEKLSEQEKKEVDALYVDSWSKIIAQFKRQIDSAVDLRIPIADPELYEEQPTDVMTVKFFKGIFNEWRYRINELPDDELRKEKDQVSLMWYTLFSLQPLFEGLNNHSLCKDILENTSRITEELRNLNFKSALNYYNIMAIGKNVWPIGASQFSIHWKFSCDLIDSDRILHLFNNSAARIAITAYKRLMNKYEEFHKKK